MATDSKFARFVLWQLHMVWQASFYLTAVGLLITISFWTISNFQLTPAFTLENYRDVLGKPRYFRAAGASLRLALIVSTLAVVFALPIAHAVTFHLKRRFRQIVLFMLLLPFFSSYVVRMFAWQAVLSEHGILNWFWEQIPGTRPLLLLFTEKAVVIGLLSVLIPIAALIMFLGLARLDKSLILAARNLGATPWQAFLRIELPIAMPSLLLGFLFCFILAFGDFVCATILGGSQVYYLTLAIEDRTKINDWPTASVLGTLLLAITLSVMALSFGCISRLRDTSAKSGGTQ